MGSNLWFADGGIVSFKGFDYPTRMVVVRLADGGLWLWSPIEQTAEIEAEVRALGPVGHIVSPNKLHYLFLGEWQAAFPTAKLWGTASTIAKCGDLQFSGALAEDPPADWEGQIDQFYFTNSPFMDELIFFHRASRTAIIADLSQTFSERSWRTIGHGGCGRSRGFRKWSRGGVIRQSITGSVSATVQARGPKSAT